MYNLLHVALSAYTINARNYLDTNTPPKIVDLLNSIRQTTNVCIERMLFDEDDCIVQVRSATMTFISLVSKIRLVVLQLIVIVLCKCLTFRFKCFDMLTSNVLLCRTILFIHFNFPKFLLDKVDGVQMQLQNIDLRKSDYNPSQLKFSAKPLGKQANRLSMYGSTKSAESNVQQTKFPKKDKKMTNKVSGFL